MDERLDERLLTTEEVARLLGVSRDYVRKAAQAKLIPAYRLDATQRTAWRFRESEIRDWIRARHQEATSA